MQAIRTRRTMDKNGNSRISAKCQAARKLLWWDDALNLEENHAAAAKALATALGWDGEWVSGWLDNLDCVWTQRRLPEPLPGETFTVA